MVQTTLWQLAWLERGSARSSSTSSVVTMDTFKNMGSPPFSQDQAQNHQTRRRENDVCFRCQVKGHWANECPTRTTSSPTKLVSSSSAASPQPVLGVRSGSTSSVVTTDTFKNMGSPPFSQDQAQNHQIGRRENDVCFRCQEKGHWANECPTRTTSSPTKLMSSSSAASPQPVLDADGLQYLPCLLCPCGGGVCPLRTSTTTKNPGRKFYCCPVLSKSEANCDFFKWSDMMTSDDLTNVPICRCGAGPCKLSTETTGRFAGRKVYICPIKKGQGACDFFHLRDAETMTGSSGQMDESYLSPNSRFFYIDESSSRGSEMVEECMLNHREVETAESSKSISFLSPQKHQIINETPMRDSLLLNLKGQDNSSDEPLRKHYKRLRDGAEKLNGSVINLPTSSLEVSVEMPHDSLEKNPHSSILQVEARIHCGQVEFWKQISIAATGIDLAGLATSEIDDHIAVYLKGWWGRLAFPPSRGLRIPSPMPFFCCVFPCFDPIPSSRTLNVLEVDASIIASNSLLVCNVGRQPPSSSNENAWQISVVPFQPHGVENDARVEQHSTMECCVSGAFKQAAVCLQSNLLSLLESINVSDYKLMEQEANTTFVALERLQVDCQPFIHQVREFIGCIASMAENEISMSSNRPIEELFDLCSLEKARLNDLSHSHDEATVALDASKERLKILNGKASRIKDMLLQVEDELCHCKAEEEVLEAHIRHISMEMDAAKYDLEEAEQAMKLCRRKEELQNSAKIAYEKARVLVKS